MALLYLDTSALVKLYIWETGSQRMLQLARSSENHQIALCAVTKVEFHSAISRRQRAGDLDSEAADQTRELFSAHLRTRFLRQAINDTVLDLASNLAAKYYLRA